ncbi:zinc-dependent metalloprotease [Streptomyces sp. NPDC005423]|uniref:zinc-dependent metalloprotease n=1 Tax=Streptomyces sp. NPDC005423 TaxID=3155343 RepID=UPI0033A5DC5B
MLPVPVRVHDATSAHPELADRITAFLTEALPQVAKVSSLPAPQAVSFQLLDTPAFIAEYVDFARGHLLRVTRDLSLTDREHIQLDHAAPPILWAWRRGDWAIRPGRITADSYGRPTTLITVPGLKAGGLLHAPDHLDHLLLVLLAEQFQVAASQGRVVPVLNWPLTFPYRRDAVGQLSDGHAHWVAEAIQRQLPPRSWPQRSPAYLLQAALEPVLEFAWMPWLLRRAVRCVEQAMLAVGPEVFNQVWNTPALLPTLSELRRPATWADRLADAPLPTA